MRAGRGGVGNPEIYKKTHISLGSLRVAVERNHWWSSAPSTLSRLAGSTTSRRQQRSSAVSKECDERRVPDRQRQRPHRLPGHPRILPCTIIADGVEVLVREDKLAGRDLSLDGRSIVERENAAQAATHAPPCTRARHKSVNIKGAGMRSGRDEACVPSVENDTEAPAVDLVPVRLFEDDLRR